MRVKSITHSFYGSSARRVKSITHSFYGSSARRVKSITHSFYGSSARRVKSITHSFYGSSAREGQEHHSQLLWQLSMRVKSITHSFCGTSARRVKSITHSFYGSSARRVKSITQCFYGSSARGSLTGPMVSLTMNGHRRNPNNALETYMSSCLSVFSRFAFVSPATWTERGHSEQYISSSNYKKSITITTPLKNGSQTEQS